MADETPFPTDPALQAAEHEELQKQNKELQDDLHKHGVQLDPALLMMSVRLDAVVHTLIDSDPDLSRAYNLHYQRTLHTTLKNIKNEVQKSRLLQGVGSHKVPPDLLNPNGRPLHGI